MLAGTMAAKRKTVKGAALLAQAVAGYRARVKRPITLKLSENVLHALARCQGDLRCVPGVRLGDATVSAVVDALLRKHFEIV
ncbi:MAG TPA: hypothetical protein VGY48_15945 [Vicinamibacterales bacterium]|jgi:hypothetical protein|nr:hypothetical protein [Vicinamibacterales bacterium]